MKRSLAALAVGVTAVGAAAAVLMPDAYAAAGCRVDYTITSQWSGGFQSDVKITNLGDQISSWTLGFDFANAAQQLTQGWNATWSQSASHVTATNLGWNGSIATNAATSVGFTGSWTSMNPVGTNFTVNGTACTGAVTTPTPTPTTSQPPVTGAAPALHVSGNRILTSSGATYRLLGVNRSGGEFACIQGNGMWDGPMDQASVTAIRTWKVRAVRVPLNEECWLGTSNVPAAGTSGTAYQNAVKQYVSLLIASGITPIVEMHWNQGVYTGPASGCSQAAAACQKPMPDAQLAPQFWTSVANAFKGNDAVVLDLFNEPFPDAANNFTDANGAWSCWKNGGTCTGISYQVAGFQSLLNTVRATGATNVVMVGGIRWSNDLTQWLANKPTDPLNNLVAFAHVYNFNACIDTGCWDREWGTVAAQVPLTISEIGENDCASGFINQVMSWADSHGVGYLGWTWNTWPCTSGPALITDYNGTATTFGQGFKDHLATVSN